MKVRLAIAAGLSIAIVAVSALLSAGSSAPTSEYTQLYAVPSSGLIRALHAQIGTLTIRYEQSHYPGSSHTPNKPFTANPKESMLTSVSSGDPARPVNSIQLVSSIKGIPWPATGEAAVGVEGLNFIESNLPDNPPVPIASLTKMMTAYVILQDHPLSPGENGPAIRVDEADIETTYNDELNDETIVPIVHGEVLTEKQALEGLMVHSACNLAYVLARWDSGTASAFVAKMNRTAKALGLASTRYVGPAGFSPGSVSTAASLTKLAMDAMSIPAFARIVDHPEINLPNAGVLENYVSAIGQNGVIGVKSGFTYQSEGCVVLAAVRYIGNTQVTMIATVTGQGGMDPLGSAQNTALAIIDSIPSRLFIDSTDLSGYIVGNIQPSWLKVHSGKKAQYSIVTSGNLSLLEWPGADPRVTIEFGKRYYTCNILHPNIQVGTMTASLGSFTSEVPLVLPHAPPCR